MSPNRAAAMLRSLLHAGLHAEVLIPALLEALHELVPSSRNLFDWTDEHGRLVRYFVEGPVDTKIAALYFEAFHNKLEAEAMPAFDSLRSAASGVRSAAELDHAGFYGSALYNEIWKPQGFRARLEAVLRTRRGRLLGSLVLYRGPGDKPFTAADEGRLAALLPDMAEALAACGPAVADDRHVPSREPPQSLLLHLDGRLAHHTPGAQRLLLLADGGLTPEALTRPPDALAGRLLPLLLQHLRRQWQAGGATALLQAPPPSIVHENGYGQFVATAQPLHPADPVVAPMVQVTIGWLEPHRVALERALRQLPLTPGQLAVCRALYRGGSHDGIAQALGVATSTVIDHVRKIYRVLELRSAIELRALVDARIGT